MSGGSASKGTVKSIDTKDFDDAVGKFKSAINIYRDAREMVFDSTEKLLFTWAGEGKDAFQKQYDQLKTKLKDEEDNLNTIKEDLENCRQAYLDWDNQLTGELKASVSK
jgi:WXG100 family type VII secretion target